eukprot:3276966-Pleurochrysis_carterae.AAC.3
MPPITHAGTARLHAYTILMFMLRACAIPYSSAMSSVCVLARPYDELQVGACVALRCVDASACVRTCGRRMLIPCPSAACCRVGLKVLGCMRKRLNSRAQA